MSSCTTTVPYSVRNSAPVGHTSRHAACVQCLQTSEDMSQRSASAEPSSEGSASEGSASAPFPETGTRTGLCCSMNATCRHVSAPSADVLSYDSPVHRSPSSGTRFHSLHATSQALQPMQSEVSVKKPTRSPASVP